MIRITIFLFSILIIIACDNNSIDCCVNPPEKYFDELGYDKPYNYGNIYYGRNNYVEFHPGSLPIILSAPHGGDMEPNEIPDRLYGTTVTDSNTKQITIAIKNEFISRFGKAPYIIINNLKRTKIDSNRDSIEGVQGNIYAKRAWEEYHYYIDYSKNKIIQDFNYGLFLDIHGHGANPDGFYDLRTWLGYLLDKDELQLSNQELDKESYQLKSSINTLSFISNESFIEVLRGRNSLGSILDSLGYNSVPSLNYPSTNGKFYFSGGYNTKIHGSAINGSPISSIQIELPKPGIRENSLQWKNYSKALVTALEKYFKTHYRMEL
tara:strand:- start:1400 stop:2365 length:966 start_codon:yes stop_codon:yes gene_type:complete